jgi:hypothetical protein
MLLLLLLLTWVSLQLQQVHHQLLLQLPVLAASQPAAAAAL